MKHYIILIGIFALNISSNAQQILNLKFADTNDSATIADAFVLDISNGRTYQTNSSGVIDLFIGAGQAEISFTIRHLNYVCDTFVINQLHLLTNTIYVKPKLFQIKPIYVTSKSANEIMQIALQQIDSMYNNEEGNSLYFYRQYHYENGREVRWIECDVELKNCLEKNRNQNVCYAQMSVSNLKRTKVTEQNKDEHGDHLADLLNQIPTLNSLGTVCNIKAIGTYLFAFDIDKETADVYVINFQSKKALHDKLEMGTVTINKSDYAILCIETQHYPTQLYYNNLLFGHSNKYVWAMQSERAIFNFSKFKSDYKLISCFKTYTHELLYSDTKQKAFVVTENFELHAAKYDSNNKPGSTKSFSQFSNLYTSGCEDLQKPNSNYPCVFCK